MPFLGLMRNIMGRQACHMIDTVMPRLNSECKPHVALRMNHAVVCESA